MRLTFAITLFLTIFPASLWAQDGASMYEATILTDDVYVRCGPDRSHYSTGKLKTGDRVSVQREYRGGWLIISPPPGSFNWVLADNIRVLEKPNGNRPGRGIVEANKTIARIGSSIQSKSHDVYHQALARGTSVIIIGEKVLDSSQGPRLSYKIKPPAGDTRWILSQYVKRVGSGPDGADPFDDGKAGAEGRDLPNPGQNQKRQRKRTHFLAEQQGVREYDGRESSEGAGTQKENQGLKKRKLVRTEGNLGTRSQTGTIRTGPSQEELKDDRARISRLDARFREILKREASQWDFAKLEQDYKNLHRSAAHPATQRRVNLRLRKVAQYKQIKAENDEYLRLTKESQDREAQILSLRSKPKPATPAPSKPAPRRRSRFSGAGIIQRSVGAPRGAPRYALVAPNGRVLAYLQAVRGLDLDRHLGRAMGINGPRTARREWGTDHIVVEKVTPVRLIP